MAAEGTIMSRYLKIALIIFVALLCLMYATQNLVNLNAAYFFVSSVVTMDGHSAYPAAFGPAIDSPFLIWAALAIIVAFELAAGLASARGAYDMWRARAAEEAEFNAAMKYAVLGCGLGLATWFGLFFVIGGAYFQMWQTELGAGSLNGSFQNSVLIGMVLLLLQGHTTPARH